MTVSTGDVHLYKSAIGDSAGGAATGTQVTGSAKNNYFADVGDIDRTAGGTRIRKSFIGNDHATDSLLKPKIWVGPDVTGFNPTELALGFDSADDDTGTAGNMVAFGANAVLELASDAADTRTATVVGIDSATALPALETKVLNGTTPVTTTIVWSKVYGVLLDAEHGTNTVTVRQGAAGAIRGTVDPNRNACFLWVAASSEATSLWLPDLIAGARWGIWEKQVWAPGVMPQIPADPILNVKQGA